jgi:hypothetical protein
MPLRSEEENGNRIAPWTRPLEDDHSPNGGPRNLGSPPSRAALDSPATPLTSNPTHGDTGGNSHSLQVSIPASGSGFCAYDYPSPTHLLTGRRGWPSLSPRGRLSPTTHQAAPNAAPPCVQSAGRDRA